MHVSVGLNGASVSVGDGAVHALNSTTVPVTVSKIPAEIIVNDTLELFISDEYEISYNLNPADAIGDVTWA